MYLQVNGDGTVSMHQLSNLRELYVLGTTVPFDKLTEIVSASGAGAVVGDYVWIYRSFIESSRGANESDWQGEFDAMVEYARARGWLSDDGQSIRAHLKMVA